MSFFDELKRMTQPYDDDEDDFLDPVMDDEPEERPAPKPRKASKPARAAAPAEPEETPVQPARPAARPAASSRGVRQADKVVNLNNGGQLKVVIVKPLRFEVVAEIADHLLGRTARSASPPAAPTSSRRTTSISWASSSTRWSRAPLSFD